MCRIINVELWTYVWADIQIVEKQKAPLPGSRMTESEASEIRKVAL